MALNPAETERYSRHLSLAEIGVGGQEKLKSARVLVVGLGGLGCPASQYLAAAGIGQLGLMDDDRVSLSNLPRQILYSTEDIGRPKVEVAARRLRAMNPDVVIETHAVRVDAGNAAGIFRRYDLIVDASDNFETRYVVNDRAIAEGKFIVFGAIDRFEAHLAVFGVAGLPCYRCLYPDAPAASRSLPGVLGVVPGMTGILLSTEVIKTVLQRADTLAGFLLTVDLLSYDFSKRRLARRPGCKVCR